MSRCVRDTRLASAVVKVVAHCKSANCEQPWDPPVRSLGHGTGFAVDARHVVTNAHVVDGIGREEVTLSRMGQSKPFGARVVFRADTLDLAMLRADEDLSPLELGERVVQESEISVYSFHNGGDDLDQPRQVFTSRHLLPGFRWLLVPLVFLVIPLTLLKTTLLLRRGPGNALRAWHDRQQTTPWPH